MYLVAALAFLFCALITATLLPKIVRQPHVNTQTTVQAPRTHRKSVLYLFIALFFNVDLQQYVFNKYAIVCYS